MKQLLKWLSFWVILIIVFLSTASYLLCYANGYRINWKAKKIQKTGLVIIKSYPSKASVFFDGREEGKAPTKISYVLPGLHEVSLKLDGHKEWSQIVNIEESLAVSLEADLFFNEPVLKDYKNNVDYSSAEKLLVKNDSEIWNNNKLITRFSKPVTMAAWDKDRRNAIYQLDNELRIISSDGLHDYLVTKLDSADACQVLPKSSYELIYKQKNVQKLVQYRDKVTWTSNIQYLNFNF